MKTFYCDHFVLPLPEGHRFPMEKYALLRQRVSGEPGVELTVPRPVTDDTLLRVHTRGYVRAVRSGQLTRAQVRGIGFPWSPELVERSRRSVGGTLAAARAALADGWGASLAGGTHHAFPDRGEGFCVFNDVAVAVRALQAEDRCARVAVLDLDVHQGNGTAAVFAAEPEVHTISVHGENNYPFRKTKGDLDLALADRTEDEEFLQAVEKAVEAAVVHRPDLVFYVAGADPFEADRLGRLAVTREALAERDRIVYDALDASDIPVVVVMGGGYARPIEETVEIHACSVLSAARRSAHPCRPDPLTPALPG